ncbi:MAG: shikimate kinase, partial [Candidatus Acidiferrales bacterium]
MKIQQRSRRLVCLTGFMGSGKSTTARQLASQLGWMNVDLDRRITEAANQSIPEIFAKKGESEFRRLEHEQLARLIAESSEDQKPRVVSLGGGTVAQP